MAAIETDDRECDQCGESPSPMEYCEKPCCVNCWEAILEQTARDYDINTDTRLECDYD